MAKGKAKAHARKTKSAAKITKSRVNSAGQVKIMASPLTTTYGMMGHG